MKQVGVLKKSPKTWALAIGPTGKLNTGWNGNGSELTGTVEEIKADILEANTYIFSNPTRPVEMAAPKIFSHHDKSISQFDRDYEAAWRVRYADIQTWDRADRKYGWKVFEEMPVFEDDLIFSGYSKGQSSFTLNFVTTEGETISFGPKNTGELVEGIIQGKIATLVDMTGRPGPVVHDYNAPRGPNNEIPSSRPAHEGNGVRMKFTFVKQGSNIYAQLVKEV
jgi:hypothetical protein